MGAQKESRHLIRGSPVAEFTRRDAALSGAALAAALVVAETAYHLFVADHLPVPGHLARAVIATGLDLACLGPVAWWTLIRPIRRSELALRSFFNNAPVGLYRSTVEGRLTMVNRTLVEMLGYDLGPDIFDLDLATQVYRSPEDRARVLERIRGLDFFDGVEAVWKRRDGAPLNVLISGRTRRDASGRVIGYEGAVENVTEQRRTQSRLQVVEHALHAAANAIVITNRDGAIEWVNAGFTQVTGHTLNDVSGMTPRVLKSGRTSADTYGDLWATIVAGRVWQGEMVNRRRDGSFYTQDLTITPVLDEHGAPTHFIGVGRDITEQRRLEAQLRQAQKMEAVGQLTGGIAHDFNNVLGVILANAELIAAGNRTLDPGVSEDLADIRAAAARGAGMVRKLLGFSRLAELQLVPLDLGEAVQGFGSMLRRVVPESVDIAVRIEERLPAVRADVGAVEQILMNLATNARDAMPDGGRLEIAVARHTLGEEDRADHAWIEPGDYVSIAVADSGHGMDAETQRRIFDPFFTTKPPGKGTGLGMPMIYGLTKQQRGFVHVYSEVGHGTTVRIYLPVDPESAAVALSPPAAESVARGRGESILLVEDEETLRRAGRRILERLGYRVLVAGDGVEALETYRANRDIDLIVSDLVMPRMGGRELYQAVRHLGSPRFILASGYAATELQTVGRLDDVVRHLPKPWTVAEMARAVREVLDAPRAKAS
ncbi:MAG TPA: PAS domain S-box protein [Gemmatimonadales bacterium]|nr:PAS domain S-box protein [Gemmatimonadales bacterium]